MGNRILIRIAEELETFAAYLRRQAEAEAIISICTEGDLPITKAPKFRELSVRARNILANNVGTFRQLLDHTPKQLYEYKNCGPTTMKEITNWLASIGYTLRNFEAEDES